MADATKAKQALKGIKRADLLAWLDTDRRVRDWLAEAVLSSSEAADFLGVERPRIWRWEKAGRITRVASTKASPLYLRADLVALKAEEEAKVAAAERARAARVAEAAVAAQARAEAKAARAAEKAAAK